MEKIFDVYAKIRATRQLCGDVEAELLRNGDVEADRLRKIEYILCDLETEMEQILTSRNNKEV